MTYFVTFFRLFQLNIVLRPVFCQQDGGICGLLFPYSILMLGFIEDLPSRQYKRKLGIRDHLPEFCEQSNAS